MTDRFRASEALTRAVTGRSKVSEVLAGVVAPGSPIAFSAFDGSSAGHSNPSVRVKVNNPAALNYIVTAPGELGMARAYVAGHLDVEGDIHAALELVSQATVGALSLRDRLEVLSGLGLGALRPLPPPPEEVRPGLWWGLRHSLGRDSKAISHHYDVSNRFYEWVLGPSMAYTCAVYTDDETTLEQAQEEKVDLVCRKLDLQPGQRLLDVGCGWGTMVRHAAAHYGVKVLGVTLSRQQADWGQKLLAEQGLSDLAEIRHQDYRDVKEDGFDAISSIGLTEHIGKRNLAAYSSFLTSRLREGGRLLNHCITRPASVGYGQHSRGFLNRYVFPDGELEAVGEIVTALHDAGLEIQHEENLRPHYARTCAAWSANLARHWDEAVAEVGKGRARVWQLYLAGSQLGFEQRRVELHQVLTTRTVGGKVVMPLRPDFSRRSARPGATLV